MSRCVHCATELSDRGPFCKKCGMRSTCANCKGILEADFTFCILCGKRVRESVEQDTQTSVFGNTFELNETLERNGSKATRVIRVACSDEAVSSFGDLVERRLRAPQFGSITDPANLEVLPPVRMDVADEVEPNHSETIVTPQSEDSRELDSLRTIFRKDGDGWKLDEIYLNVTGKGDYGKRLTFLFLYLNELEGKPKTARSVLNQIIEDSTLYDGNFRNWLANETAIVHEGDLLSLNAAGRRAAKEHAAQVMGAKLPNQWLPGNRSAKRSSGKANSQSQPEEREIVKRSSGKVNPSGKKLAAQWKALGLAIDIHNTFAARSECDKGLVALWAIRKATQDEIKEVSTQGMNTFLFEAFELSVHKRSLERGLNSDAAKGLAIKRKGTMFQILPPGIQHIEKVLNL